MLLSDLKHEGMSDEIKHSDLFKYSKEELEDLKDIILSLSKAEDRLAKYNLTIDDLKSFPDFVLNKS